MLARSEKLFDAKSAPYQRNIWSRWRSIPFVLGTEGGRFGGSTKLDSKQFCEIHQRTSRFRSREGRHRRFGYWGKLVDGVIIATVGAK